MLKVDIHSIKINNGKTSRSLLENISLQLNDCEIISIIGSNGSGKSTLLFSLMSNDFSNLIEVNGNVIYEGVDLYSNSQEAIDKKKRIRIVFQDSLNSFNPQHTLEQIISNEKIDLTNLEEIVNYFELPEIKTLKKKFIWELSSGMAQRFAISAALASPVNLMLLDEPTSALDLYTSNLLKNLILKFCNERKISFALVTQNLNFAKSVSNSILEVKNKTLQKFI